MKRDCPKRNRSLCQHKSSAEVLCHIRTLHNCCCCVPIWIPEEDKVVESCNVSFCQVDQNSSYSGAVLVLEISDVKEDEDELVDSVEIGEKYLMKISQVPVCSPLIRWYLKAKRQIPEKVKMTMGTNHPFLLHVKSFEQEKS
ncbi:hypothetical protein TNCV_2442361 [Trichonephila clavipes]|nr:hypothetical protein TNCV_2442361 [Trichonephila clavipes]